MGKKKIILDTNVIISAFCFGGIPKRIIEKITNNQYELYISEKQFFELERVLNYKKFELSYLEKNRILNLILNISTLIETKIELNIIKENPSDNMFLELAQEINADLIISGDKHLKKIKKYNNTKIISPNQFLKS